MRIPGKLGVSLLATLALVLAAEAVVRVSGRAPPFFHLQPRIWRVPAEHLARKLELYGRDKGERFRVATLGESTVLGWPLPQHLSFPSLMEGICQQLPLGRTVQVVNLATEGIHAQDVLDIMTACEPLQPDLYLVMTGHNEFANRVFWKPPPRWLYRSLTVSHLLRWLLAPPAEVVRPVQFQTDMSNQLMSLPIERVGQSMLDNMPIEDWERDVYLERYEHALRGMIGVARARNQPIVFAEPLVNLKDYAPYVPNPASADAFARGQALLAAGRAAESKRAFEEALDLDGGPLRMPGPFLARLRAVCAAENVPLIPTRTFIEAESKDGIPGHERILDNLHLNVAGAKTIALGVTQALLAQRLLPGGPVDAAAWDSVRSKLDPIALPASEQKEQEMRSDFYLGCQYFAAGNLAGAETRLRRVLDVHGGRDEVTVKLLWLIYTKQGRQDEIRKVEERLKK
jgi:lysophospholipase L1-like esterase